MLIEQDTPLVRFLMKEHWQLVDQKPYRLLKGLWEKRRSLPVTHTSLFREVIGEPLEIPMQGGGCITLGKNDDRDPGISVNVKFPNARGEMLEDGFVITREWGRSDKNEFRLRCKAPEQDECIKFLGRVDPQKDIAWDCIKPDTTEFEIAEALCKYPQRVPSNKIKS